LPEKNAPSQSKFAQTELGVERSSTAARPLTRPRSLRLALRVTPRASQPPLPLQDVPRLLCSPRV
jgi:hypothetical protein